MRRIPAQIRRIRAGKPSRGVTTPVSLVYLPVSLTGPGPSGSAEPARLCRGCSRPSRRPPGRAASSFIPPLRRRHNGRSFTSIRNTRASWRSYDRPTAPPAGGADPNGFSMFRTHETRLGPGALCTPGTTAPTRPGTIPSRRLPPPIGRSLSPRHHDPSRDVQLTRHLQEFTGVHPRPAFPSPVVPGRIGNPWAFPRAPHPPAQETGTHVAAGTGLTALTRTTSSASSRTSNRRTHSLRATSCRNCGTA